MHESVRQGSIASLVKHKVPKYSEYEARRLAGGSGKLSSKRAKKMEAAAAAAEAAAAAAPGDSTAAERAARAKAAAAAPQRKECARPPHLLQRLSPFPAAHAWAAPRSHKRTI